MDQDRASTLFAMRGVRVVEVDTETDGGTTVWLATDEDQVAACPDCDVASTRMHEWVLTRPHDVPPHDIPLWTPDRGADTTDYVMVWVKRRWRCENPDCPRQTFTESIPQIPARARLTNRTRERAAHLIGELGVPVSGAATACGLSWHSAHQAFTERADPILEQPLAPVRVLGIDETRRGRPKYRYDPETGHYVLVTDRWHTGFVDLSGEQGLLGQVEGRTAEDAAYWLYQAGLAWRQRVDVVVIDMCGIYAAAVRRMLPHATLAVDPFHVVQLATKMVGDVRRRVVRAKYGRRGRTGDVEYGVKNLLVRNVEHLTPEQFSKILIRLEGDEHGRQVLLAWIAKEKLRDLIRLRQPISGCVPTREQVRHALYEFFAWCATYEHIPELVTLACTVDRWRDPIINAVLLGVSNARSEGLNRVIKLEGRKAYGFRNPVNQRRRLRYATTRSTRRPSRTVTNRGSRKVIKRLHDPG